MNSDALIQPHLSAIVAVYAGLLAFGVVYNGLVAWLEQHKALEGFTWAAVAVGVAVGIALIWDRGIVHGPVGNWKK